MLNSSFANIISTLVTNGFNVEKVDRLPHENTIIHTCKYDKLGAKVNYSILFTDDKVENSLTDTLVAEAEKHQAKPLLICDNFSSAKCSSYTNEIFFNFFGGVINAGLVLIPGLPEILDKLGHNTLPDGLTGKPDDLHELYVKDCLQFIMESPTRRYGIDRSFESLPDAVILCKEGFMLLVDSKAYKNGFGFEADDLKRFKSYVEDFRSRYSFFFGNPFSFVVVSGHFTDSEDSIANRSSEFYKMCGCKLSCLSSKELGLITEVLRDNAEIRGLINWKNIYSELIIDTAIIQKEIDRIKKDKLH